MQKCRLLHLPQIIRVETQNFMIKIHNGFHRHQKFWVCHKMEDGGGGEELLSGGAKIVMHGMKGFSSTVLIKLIFLLLSSDRANWIERIFTRIWLNNWTVAKTNKWWHNDSKLGKKEHSEIWLRESTPERHLIRDEETNILISSILITDTFELFLNLCCCWFSESFLSFLIDFHASDEAVDIAKIVHFV